MLTAGTRSAARSGGAVCPELISRIRRARNQHAEAGLQITQSGTAPDGCPGDQISDHNGGYLESSVDNAW